MLVDGYLGYIVESLSYDTRLKLTLMVWHFNDKELRKFLRSPIDKTEWKRFMPATRSIVVNRSCMMISDTLLTFCYYRSCPHLNSPEIIRLTSQKLRLARTSNRART